MRGEAYVPSYIDAFWLIAWVRCLDILLILLLRPPPNPLIPSRRVVCRTTSFGRTGDRVGPAIAAVGWRLPHARDGLVTWCCALRTERKLAFPIYARRGA